MKRVGVVLLMAAVALTGCWEQKTKTFQGAVERVENGRISVNCSDEMNRGKRGAIEDIGYVCGIETTPQTVYRDEDGSGLKASDFKAGEVVKVILTKAVDFHASKPGNRYAETLILLHQDAVTREDILLALGEKGLKLTAYDDPDEISLTDAKAQAFVLEDGGELVLYEFPSMLAQEKGWGTLMNEWESRGHRGGTNFNLQRFLLILYAGQTASDSTFGTIQQVMHNLAEY
ncbi:hypothetical protein SAMN02799624_06146 [Paenibacillus sp. UNC496MF]|uniref:hypothetical protein n=1 Tax=Paenibacillus sp. UNC496MF TaxID=1502753 RepID=UPI0008E42287|nr:hypothetical protein [Paenibacillus sp. UNC496MF]SFJ82725.1 hypothetical protein SAMN02799624_06146 [Paenibacillus sp. UNC496MF]